MNLDRGSFVYIDDVYPRDALPLRLNYEDTLEKLSERSLKEWHIICLNATQYEEQGCSVRLRFWAPYACQGCCFPQSELRYLPNNPHTITWSRAPMDQINNALTNGFEILFSLIMKAVAGRCKIEISSLGHDSAKHGLYSALMNNEARLEFKGSQDDPRNLQLCTMLLKASVRLRSARYVNLQSNSQNQIDPFFGSLLGNTFVQMLDLSTHRYLRTWNKAHTSRHKKDQDTVSIRKLVEAIDDPRTAIQEIELGSLNLDLPSVKFLANKLPNLERLQNLSLRDTGLDESTLIAVFEGLKTNHSVKELDISHNALTMKAMKSLCDLLISNTRLHRLVAEHCSIDFLKSRTLADTLPKMEGLRHLELDGNEFTWMPLLPASFFPYLKCEDREVIWARVPSDRNSQWKFPDPDDVHFSSCEPEGVTLMGHALQFNKSLVTLSMRETGFMPVSMVCCTSPPYHDMARAATRTRIRSVLEGNKEQWEMLKHSRMQQAVVNIVGLALKKLTGEA